VRSFDLAENRVQCLVLVNTVLDLRVLQKAGNFFFIDADGPSQKGLRLAKFAVLLSGGQKVTIKLITKLCIVNDCNS
jgi:hypothetical protein